MVAKSRKRRTNQSLPKDFDIDSIDPSVFDDPILLLEYLERLDKNPAKSTYGDNNTTQTKPDYVLPRTTVGNKSPTRIKAKTRKEQNKAKVAKDGEEIFSNVDEFLAFIMTKGAQTKDNRWNDGCVWIQADTNIDAFLEKAIINGRQFKYKDTCRAFHGKPGWYY